MSSQFLLFLFSTCILWTGTISIRYGGNVQQRRPDNQAVVVIHHHYPESSQRYSIGTLIHRKFLISHGGMEDGPLTKMWVRIGTLKQFHGGVVRYLDWCKELSQTDTQDKLMKIMLIRMSRPYELFDEAFLVLPGLLPTSRSTRMVFNGFHGDCLLTYSRMNHEMNAMGLVKASEACFEDSYQGQKPWKEHLQCYYSDQCDLGKECRHKQNGGFYDSGSGIYIKNTNIVVGVAVTRFPGQRMNEKVIAIKLEPYYNQLITLMREKNNDEYEDYPEWLPESHPFHFQERHKAMLMERQG